MTTDKEMLERMERAAEIIPDLDALADEVQTSKAKPCWVCSIPERAWVDKAIREGRSMPVIAAVLLKQGHAEATEHRVKTHKYKHVR